MSKEIRPLGNRVLVKRRTAETTTESGIVIPDTAQKKHSRGEVLAVGPGARLDNGDLAPMSVKVGDVVILGDYSGTEVRGEEGLIIVLEDDILGVEVSE